MAPEERALDTGICLPADACEERSERESLGMTERSDGVDAGHVNGHCAGQVAEAIMKGPSEEENVVDTICSSKPLDTSPACADTSKGSELAGENLVGNMTLVPHVNHRLSVQALKERLKDKLKKKLKPKLRLSYFKHRQESSSQVIPWISTKEVTPPNQNGDAASVAYYADIKPLSSDVTPLKTAGVKTEPEEGVLDVPPPLLSLGREPTGQLVVANVSNGRRKAGNKMSQLSRVNRFADSILQFMGERSVPEKLIRGALGNNPDISKAIRLLLSEKKLKRLGDGGKGCAYVYVRTDLTEAEPKTKELDPVDINAQALTIEREFVRELERRFPATNILDSTVWNVLNGCGRMQGDHVQCDV